MPTTIKVVKAFNLLTATNAKPQRFEVGEHEVDEDVAGHWYVRQHLEQPKPAEEPVPELDPATASRDEIVAYLHAALDARIASLSDDKLRDWAVWMKEHGEEEIEADAAGQDAPADEPQRQDAGAPEPDPAARKTAIRDQLKAMGAALPHHNASLDKHEAALAAAQAAQGAPAPQPEADQPADQAAQEQAAPEQPAPAPEQAAAPAAEQTDAAAA